MKNIFAIAFFLLVVLSPHLSAQSEKPDTPEWPASTSIIGLYAGYLGDIIPTGLMYEQLWHMERVHIGPSAGVLHTFYQMDGTVGVLGFYLAGVLLTGKGAHHFEARLGASYHPIMTFPEGGSRFDDVPFMPVVTVGYRHQLPDSKNYLRVSFGTGGLGIGLGFIIH